MSKLLPKYIETQVLARDAGIFGVRVCGANDGDGIGDEERRRRDRSTDLHMNKVRQAAITKEIIEIVSGAAYGAS